MGPSMNRIIQRLRRASLGSLTDQELLDALVTRHDEAAFETLLRRHGPMVLAVCRRVLRDAHDAEDAFQAVWLVLARKAATVRGGTLAGWLHGTARLLALKCHRAETRRRQREARGLSVAPDRPPLS